ncbi:glucose-1-phosphatase-like [Danaus plexippus]|uniref:glucose-1-phosphatase-like n=1 Tax=Danaus plexippus TaxID=13037 RepID=UPI002AB15F8E|nr:glucose-1-phosphatase-like [Danaus plexippus]
MGNFGDFLPLPWPKWNISRGYSTKKGALIEEYLGEYMYKWLVREKLLDIGCPDESSVFIYANTLQRTRESAKSFVRGAFKNCNISVFSLGSKKEDPLFYPVIRNDSEVVKEPIVKEMKKKLMDLDLRRSYFELEEVLDMKNLEKCKVEGQCRFDVTENEIYYKLGEMPLVIGPLSFAHMIVDSFLMSYYDGHAMENVAWGRIKNEEQWIILAQLMRESQNVIYNSTLLGRQLAKPLLEYLTSTFNEENPPKFTLLDGHDANLYSVLAALGVKEFWLPEQYESIPIAGKLVFQKLYDRIEKRYLLKLDFVYLTVDQIRNGSKISTKNPPRWVPLKIKECAIDLNGYCSWEKFIKVLKNVSSD